MDRGASPFDMTDGKKNDIDGGNEVSLKGLGAHKAIDYTISNQAHGITSLILTHGRMVRWIEFA